jgi:hypothetical protein
VIAYFVDHHEINVYSGFSSQEISGIGKMFLKDSIFFLLLSCISLTFSISSTACHNSLCSYEFAIYFHHFIQGSDLGEIQDSEFLYLSKNS